MWMYKTWDEVPEKTRKDLAKGIDEESLTDSIKAVLLRTANAEKAVVEKKGEAKEAKKETKEALTEKEQMEKMLADFRKEKSAGQIDDFLEGKEISDEERTEFEELVNKGVDPEVAYQSAAKDSIEVAKNQANLENNELGGKSLDLSGGTISADDYSRKAEEALQSPEALKEFWEIEQKISSQELKVV